MTPEEAMRRALTQARRASGRSWPNPPVGAVVLRGDRVLGRGFTRPPGGPHAEVVAIEAARRRHGAAALRGATLAVTLEPCCHHGRTPPCTDAILAAGISRVWMGHRDPNPRVAGRGLRILRAAGLDLELGVLEADCLEQHRGFLSRIGRGRPFVTVKLAASLDGRIATSRGESRWISGAAARRRVHALRAQSDAIAVGSATAAADDPELTARRGAAVVHRPVRVVFDSALSLSPRSRLVRAPDPGRTWVLAARGAAPRRRRALEAAGVRVLAVAERDGHLDLRRALALLAREGLNTLLVEGGGGLVAALLRADLVDEVHWFAAPTWLGEEGRPALGALGLRRLGSRPVLADPKVSRLGEDLYLRGSVETAQPEGKRRARRPGARAR